MWKYFVILMTIFSQFRVAKQEYGLPGSYPDLESIGLNLLSCGLIYVPRNIHLILYNSNCFGNNYTTKVFRDFTSETFGSRRDWDKLSDKNMTNKPNNRAMNPVDDFIESSDRIQLMGKSEKRVYGGWYFKKGMNSPFTVYLHFKDPLFQTRIQFCSGSLITFEWVLTAAFCFGRSATERDLFRNGRIIVSAGSYRIFEDDEQIDANNNKIFIHPNYTDTDDNDMALIKLYKRFGPKVSQNSKVYSINTICLPESGQTNNQSEEVVFYGYGFRDSNLLKVRDGLTVGFAQMKLNSSGEKSKMTTTLSDIDKSGKKPVTCPGDSGGPLVKYAKNDWFSRDKHTIHIRGVVVGVAVGRTADKPFCDAKTSDSLFTSVSNNIDWILKVIQEF